jgi:hypothetical protein
VTRNQYAPSSSIGGPSFLGLSNEPEREGEYLLEDESSSRGGLRTLVLLAILAAILGLIFVQWRSSYKASSPAPVDKPHPTQPQGKNAPPALPGSTKPAQNASTEANAAPPGIADSAKTANADQLKPVTGPDKTDQKKEVATASKQDDASPEDPDQEEAAAHPVKASATKQKPSAALLRAQQYLQGRGVPQSCEQGLMYLKAATEEQDPRAAIQMGALYSSGYCVEQDRVKAYKWFSSARDMEPANPWIEKNLNGLWAQMTPEERRRVQQ